MVVGILMIMSGWVGFAVGEQKLKVEFKNWKPAVVVNRNVVGKNGVSEADFALFWRVWDRVSELYVDKEKLDSKKMIDGAISGMVAAIGDPYTSYLPVQQNKESKEDLGGAFEGVGIQLGYDKDNRLSVMTPIEGSPAFRAGVKTGDLILRIQDEKAGVDKTTDGLNINEAVKLIRGKGGSKVKLTMYRQGQDKPFDVELTRETIVVKSVTMEYKDHKGKKIAWIKLSRFGDRTREEWNAAITDIESKGDVDGIVLDLRNNPGGYLEGSVYIAGEFLAPGKLVVAQQYGDGTRQENKVDRNGRMLKMPLSVIVNGGSASASEILSGALQDHKRAKVVGEQSFGKGSVQQPEDFPDGSGIHVTIAKWLRPSNDWIDKKGIKPDFVVEVDETVVDKEDPQLTRAMDAL